MHRTTMDRLTPIDRLSPEDRCKVCTARGKGFCRLLDDGARTSFAARAYRTLYHSGDEIIGQGEDADRIGVIVSGLVKSIAMTEYGDEHVMQILRPGQLVGIMDTGRHTNGFEAATDTSICWTPREAWNSALNAQPAHFQAYMAAIVQQFQDAQRAAIRMRGRNTLQRVAVWLLEQVPAQARTGTPSLRIPLTRRDLASYLDMTAETLCRGLHQLVERDAIRLLAPDHIQIVDAGKLRELGKYPQERKLEATRGIASVRQEPVRQKYLPRQETGAYRAFAAEVTMPPIPLESLWRESGR